MHALPFRILPLLAALCLLLPGAARAAQEAPPQNRPDATAPGGYRPTAEIPGVSRPIVVGGDRDYPPYEFLDANGQPAGYNVDLTRAIAEVMGMRVEFRLGAWNEMRTALADGGVDLLQGISFSEERLKEVDFAPPHTIVNHAIFARRGARPMETLEDLRGYRVTLHKGGIMHDTIRQMGFEHDLVFSDTPADALRLLASGRVDYAVTAMLPGMYIIRENHLDNLDVVARSVATVRYGHAVRKGNDVLLARISEGLAILDQTGKYEEIRQKWLGVLENRPIRWSEALKSISLVLAPMAALLLGSMIWTHTLRRRVAERTRSLSSALDQLRQNQRQLLQADKMAALGTLVSGVAHEINNPNGLILLNLPMLKKVQADADRLLEEHQAQTGDFTLGGIPFERMRQELPAMLDEMQEAALRIKRIVNDLKDFSRSDEGAGSELVDVNDAARKSLRLVEAALRKATRRFSAVFAQDLPMVRGSSQRVEQVLVNLLLNACQALPDPGRAIRLETAQDAADGAVAITVQDEGVGVDPKHLAHLTDPFFTTKRATGGTGLGLSVSAGIVKELGGSINFDSRPGQGMKVTVLLPAVSEESEA